MDLGGKSFRRVHCSIPVKVTLSNSAVGSPFHPLFSPPPPLLFFLAASIQFSFLHSFSFFFFFSTNFITLFPSLSLSFFFSISSVFSRIKLHYFPSTHSRFIRDERINFLRKSRNLVFFIVKEISIQSLKSYWDYCSWSRYTFALSTREF